MRRTKPCSRKDGSATAVTSDDLDLICSLLNFPSPDHEPKRKDQLNEGNWEEESKACIRVKIWLQWINDPDKSVEHEQNANDPRDVMGSINQIAKQTKMNPEDDQAKGPIVPIGIQQKENLRVERTGTKSREVNGCMQEPINGRQIQQADESNHGVYQTEPGSK